MSSNRRHGWAKWWGAGPRPRGPNGEKLCKMCPAPVGERRREYCSEACREAYLVRTSSSYARAMVERRDRGICAGCGFDTGALSREYADATRADRAAMRDRCQRCDHEEPVPEFGGYPSWMLSGRCTLEVQGERCGGSIRHVYPETARAVVVEKMRAHGFPVATLRAFMANGSAHLWEMDHATPVVEGGGACGLENLRTLCIPCHREATRDLARRRSHVRRMAKRFAERGRTLF
jgi:hypothetical protein